MKVEPLHIDSLPSLVEDGPIFSSREWAESIGNSLKAYAVSTGGGEQVAVFLLFHSGKLGMNYSITSPFSPHIGLHVQIPSEKLESKQSKMKAIHQAIADFVSARKDALVEFCLPVRVTDSQAYTWAEFEVRPRHTYHIDLARSKEELLAAMSPERRKNIRKAEEEGLKVEKVKDVERFKKVIHKTIERQGISMNHEIFDRILRSETLAGNRTMYICSDALNDLAASLVMHDDKQAYYLIGGYDPVHAHAGAGTLNLWHAILDSKARGNKVFDLEGSMIAEVERYFRGFGGELKTYFSVEKKNIIGKIASKIKGG